VRRIFGFRASAIFETLFILIAITVLSFVFGDGDRYLNVYPHPFWIVVLLIAAQYGTGEAIMSALLSSIFLLAFNIPEQALNESIYEYLFAIIKRPILWFSMAVIIGQLRMRHIEEREELKTERNDAVVRKDAITTAYTNLKEVKEFLETKLAGQLSGVSSAYKAIRSIESLNQSRILLGLSEVVETVMRPEKFSIYALGGGGFESATCEGWEDDEIYSRRFSTDSDLYKKMLSEKRVFCIVNKDDAKILDVEGVIAAPLIDSSTGEVFGMIKIEQLDFDELTLSNIDTFRVLCEWIGVAYANAAQYRELEDASMVDRETGLFSYNYFTKQSALFSGISLRNKSPLIETKVHLVPETPLTGEKKVETLKLMRKLLKEIIPDDFQLFVTKRQSTDIIILTPFMALKDVKKYNKKIEKVILGSSNHILSYGSLEVIHKEIGYVSGGAKK